MTSTTGASIGFGLDLPAPHNQAIAEVTAALKVEGFGVLTTIDVKETLRQKIGADFRPYTILGACNPPLAHQALSTDLEVGLMLPCNVIVYDTGEGMSRVEILDPAAAFQVVNDDRLRPVMEQARERLLRVVESLKER